MKGEVVWTRTGDRYALMPYIPYCTVQYSTVQYSPVQYSTVLQLSHPNDIALDSHSHTFLLSSHHIMT